MLLKEFYNNLTLEAFKFVKKVRGDPEFSIAGNRIAADLFGKFESHCGCLKTEFDKQLKEFDKTCVEIMTRTDQAATEAPRTCLL